MCRSRRVTASASAGRRRRRRPTSPSIRGRGSSPGGASSPTSIRRSMPSAAPRAGGPSASARCARPSAGSASARTATEAGAGSIPAMLNSTLALKARCGADDEAVRRGHEAVEAFRPPCRGASCFSPASRPSWDTALVAKAMLDSGVRPDDPRLARAGEWLIERQILGVRGDWAKKRPIRPSGRLGLRVRERLLP